MGKHRHVAQAVEDYVETQPMPVVQDEKERIPLDEMPLNSVNDYKLYNDEARRLTREARKLDRKMKITPYPAKQCPVELHPMIRVTFRRNDQPTNPLPVFLSNDKIHYDELLIPGKTYDLPEVIVTHLAGRGDPEWGWVDLPDGGRETRIVNKKPRFSLTHVYQDE